MDKSIEAVKFNCAQRKFLTPENSTLTDRFVSTGAHGNTMEFLPHVLFFTAFLGLRRPILAASLGAVWTAGEFFNFRAPHCAHSRHPPPARVLYTLGYITGDPKKVCALQLSSKNRSLSSFFFFFSSQRNTRGGFFSSIAYVGLLLASTHAGVELARGQW